MIGTKQQDNTVRGIVTPSSTLSLHVKGAPRPLKMGRRDPLWPILKQGLPARGLDPEVNDWRIRNQLNLWRSFWPVLAARHLRVPNYAGLLWLTRMHADGREPTYFGLATFHLVTTAGVGFIVDAFQGTVEPEIMRYHGIGTGTNAPAIGDTALQTEITTEYNPNNTRATGSLTEGASANIFQTVGTNTVDASVAATEFGLFSQAATGGGTMLERATFTVINLGNGDGLQSTYDLTFPDGG